MHYKNVRNLVIEGPDGVGKTTLIKGLFKHYDYSYMCYHRGEISNYIFAKKYKRTYYVTQKNLPLVYIVLVASEEALKERILERSKQENWVQDDLTEELSKVNDSNEFIEAAKTFSKEYDVKIFDTSGKSSEEVLKEVCEYLDSRYEEEPKDLVENYSQWSLMYKAGCEKLGKVYEVIDNQPYIDKVPVVTETTIHNGAYETFTDKAFPVNLIFALGYGTLILSSRKSADFQYIINSKIKNRPEVYEYYEAFEKAGLSCITSDNDIIPHYNKFIRSERAFGEKYLNNISRARATVYTAREVEHMKIQTGRLYEGIIADNIVFFDIDSDKNFDQIKNIYKEEADRFIELLAVTPETIAEKYKRVLEDGTLRGEILYKQHKYLNYLVQEVSNERV